MTLFNNLSEVSLGGDSDSSPPSAVFVNRKCLHQERLPGSVSAAAGGAALRAEQVLSDLASSPPLPSPGSALQPSQAARSLTQSETQSSREASNRSRPDGHPTSSGDSQARSLAVSEPDGPWQRRGGWPLLGPLRWNPAPHGRYPPPPSLRNATATIRLTPEPPLPQEHPSGVTGPLKSKSDGHPYRSPWPPLSPPCSRPLPKTPAGPGDARVGTLRTPL